MTETASDRIASSIRLSFEYCLVFLVFVRFIPTISMISQAVAIELYRERMERTAIIRLPRDGMLYRRSDIIAAVESRVNRNNIAAFGQLENNLRWEVVFTDTASKNNFMGVGMCEVKGQPASVENLRRATRQLRMQRVPMCVPNEFLSYLLRKEGVKVVGVMSYEVDREFGLKSNTRVATISADDWDAVPDVLPWAFQDLRGTALVFLQGRPPRCYRCAERGHKFYDCPYPYCRRCRESGHVESEACGRLTYAQTTSGRRPAVTTVEDEELVRMQDEAEDETQETTVTVADHQQQKPDWFDLTGIEQTNSVTNPDQPSTDQRPETTTGGETATAATASVTAIVTDSEMATDNDVDGDDESCATVDADGYVRPRAHVRRQRRTKKRTAQPASSSDTAPKKKSVTKSASSASGSETETTRHRRSNSTQLTTTELDPTSGRVHTRSRIPTGGRHHSTLAAADVNVNVEQQQ